jgi:hypothetical protein
MKKAKRMESLDNDVTFHLRKYNAEGCNGPCNHDKKSVIRLGLLLTICRGPTLCLVIKITGMFMSWMTVLMMRTL